MRASPKLGEFETKVGEFWVPVLMPAKVHVVVFKEGVFTFWTAMLKKPVGGKQKIWGRAVVGLTAGDRFDRMKIECRASYIPKEWHAEYKDWWNNKLKRGANVAYIRPSTSKEIARWLKTHPDDKCKRYKAPA